MQDLLNYIKSTTDTKEISDEEIVKHFKSSDNIILQTLASDYEMTLGLIEIAKIKEKAELLLEYKIGLTYQLRMIRGVYVTLHSKDML